jgi:hypothetical protein
MIKELMSYPMCRSVEVPSNTKVEPQGGELYRIINKRKDLKRALRCDNDVRI